jgi:hypothetical protein
LPIILIKHHPRESGDPDENKRGWVPAFVVTTEKEGIMTKSFF